MGLRLKKTGVAPAFKCTHNVVLPGIADVKKLIGLASSFVHCYFEDAGVGLINGVMVLRKDLERDQIFDPENFGAAVAVGQEAELEMSSQELQRGSGVGEYGARLVTTLEVDLGQVGAEGVVGTACFSRRACCIDLSRIVSRSVSLPHNCSWTRSLMVTILINGEVLGGIRVDLCELVKDLLKGMARESLEIPKGTVDVEGYGCDVGEVGHCSGNSSIFIR